MDPLQIAAQFAAFIWFCNRHATPPDQRDEAVRFAKANWLYFLPTAHEGLGRLLLNIAQPRLPSHSHARAGRAVRSSRSRAKLAMAT